MAMFTFYVFHKRTHDKFTRSLWFIWMVTITNAISCFECMLCNRFFYLIRFVITKCLKKKWSQGNWSLGEIYNLRIKQLRIQCHVWNQIDHKGKFKCRLPQMCNNHKLKLQGNTTFQTQPWFSKWNDSNQTIFQLKSNIWVLVNQVRYVKVKVMYFQVNTHWTKKTAIPTSRCSENNGVLCCSFQKWLRHLISVA